MSIETDPSLPTRPHIVVVGNHKGGSGKSTVAMHIIVALLKAGRRVATLDLDVTQQTLTHYIENRKQWACHNNIELEIPSHCVLTDCSADAADSGTDSVMAQFVMHLERIERERRHEFLVIDTPGGVQNLSLVAHGMADTLVTPINDSLVDLDVIVAIGPTRDGEPQLSRYARTVGRALEGRRSVCARATDWIVLRNRLATVASRNQRQVADQLEAVRGRLGFRVARGLSERLVFREFFPLGLTAFDRIERPILGATPNPANLVARLEVRDLVEEIGLLARPADADSPPAPRREPPDGEAPVAAVPDAVVPAKRRLRRRTR
jgi:chromosome partitioning protein